MSPTPSEKRSIKRRHKPKRPLSNPLLHPRPWRFPFPNLLPDLRTRALTSPAAYRICFAHDHNLPIYEGLFADLEELFVSTSEPPK